MWETIAASAAGSAIGGLIGSDSAEDAAYSQADSADRAIRMQKAAGETARIDAAPWTTAGSAAQRKLAGYLGLGPAASDDPRYRAIYDKLVGDYEASHRARYGVGIYNENADVAQRERTLEMFRRQAEAEAQAEAQAAAPQNAGPGLLERKFTLEDFENDPVMKKSFEFGLSEGEKAVQRMFGAKGMGRSGAAVKAATRFATDYAGSKAGESRARFIEDQNNTYNRLAGVSNTGLAATGATTSANMSTANNVGGLIVGEGNARGAAAIARGNAIGGAVGNIGNTIAGQYTLDRILTNGGISGGGTRLPFSTVYGGNDYAVG